MIQAQDWAQRWIHAATACPYEQLWFNRSYNFASVPERAVIEIASSGRFVLYVNGRNVTTHVFEPARMTQGDTICVVRYDVLPYLKRGTNNVAVWYSPLPDSIININSAQKQLAVTFYGTESRRVFAHFTDESWRCTSAMARTMPNGEEIIDGRYHINGSEPPVAFHKQVERLSRYKPSVIVMQQTDGVPTRLGLVHDCGLWEDTHKAVELPDSTNRAESVSLTNNIGLTDSTGLADSLRVDSIVTDSTTVVPVPVVRRLAVGCGATFNGWVRVTLQKMKAGDELIINGLTYTCNGKDDEQACRRFTAGPSGYIVITGPSYFNRDNIVAVEAIELLPPEQYYVRPYMEDRNSYLSDESIVFYDEMDNDEEDGDDDTNTGIHQDKQQP